MIMGDDIVAVRYADADAALSLAIPDGDSGTDDVESSPCYGSWEHESFCTSRQGVSRRSVVADAVRRLIFSENGAGRAIDLKAAQKLLLPLYIRDYTIGMRSQDDLIEVNTFGVAGCILRIAEEAEAGELSPDVRTRFFTAVMALLSLHSETGMDLDASITNEIILFTCRSICLCDVAMKDVLPSNILVWLVIENLDFATASPRRVAMLFYTLAYIAFDLHVGIRNNEYKGTMYEHACNRAQTLCNACYNLWNKDKTAVLHGGADLVRLLWMANMARMGPLGQLLRENRQLFRDALSIESPQYIQLCRIPFELERHIGHVGANYNPRKWKWLKIRWLASTYQRAVVLPSICRYVCASLTLSGSNTSRVDLLQELLILSESPEQGREHYCLWSLFAAALDWVVPPTERSKPIHAIRTKPLLLLAARVTDAPREKKSQKLLAWILSNIATQWVPSLRERMLSAVTESFNTLFLDKHANECTRFAGNFFEDVNILELKDLVKKPISLRLASLF